MKTGFGFVCSFGWTPLTITSKKAECELTLLPLVCMRTSSATITIRILKQHQPIGLLAGIASRSARLGHNADNCMCRYLGIIPHRGSTFAVYSGHKYIRKQSWRTLSLTRGYFSDPNLEGIQRDALQTHLHTPSHYPAVWEPCCA